MGVITLMGEKELGERNLGFDSLKSRLNMKEKGIVVVCGLRRIDDPIAGQDNGMSERRDY